ncbi:uncharacterized protein SRS1_11658 [Sporisorium reilianum f. sp. reilianum]|uniref:Uncharacterized protein n=1 Tax=Sporisorium reilianum f. sp. reilianum TaxID=72559 RepID=A0A2N8U5L1_9BASI|nr:uncharacterized protein SRS1_11658 [Sporisorium reilianum f. sp. reilianum]
MSTSPRPTAQEHSPAAEATQEQKSPEATFTNVACSALQSIPSDLINFVDNAMKDALEAFFKPVDTGCGFIVTGYMGAWAGASWLAFCRPMSIARKFVWWHRNSSTLERYLYWSTAALPGMLHIQSGLRSQLEIKDAHKIWDEFVQFKQDKEAARAQEAVTP